MKKRTRATHLPEVEVPPDNRPLVAPVYQSVKFTFDSVAESERESRGQREGFQYSRVANPTLRQLELTLAELQGRDGCLLTASGVAAADAVPVPVPVPDAAPASSFFLQPDSATRARAIESACFMAPTIPRFE